VNIFFQSKLSNTGISAALRHYETYNGLPELQQKVRNKRYQVNLYTHI